MNNLRKRQIREVLDSDKNINLRVAAIQKRNYSTNEKINPYTQVNEDEIRKMLQMSYILKQLLERKYLFAKQFNINISSFSNIHKYIIELAQTSEIVAMYNNILSIYLNPRNSQDTKAYIKRILGMVEEPIKQIITELTNIITYMKSHRIENVELLIYALTVYEIIKEQFNKNNFYIIANTDIKHDYALNLKNNKSSPQIFNIGEDDDNAYFPDINMVDLDRDTQDSLHTARSRESIDDLEDYTARGVLNSLYNRLAHRDIEEITTPTIPRLGQYDLTQQHNISDVNESSSSDLPTLVEVDSDKGENSDSDTNETPSSNLPDLDEPEPEEEATITPMHIKEAERSDKFIFVIRENTDNAYRVRKKDGSYGNINLKGMQAALHAYNSKMEESMRITHIPDKEDYQGTEAQKSAKLRSVLERLMAHYHIGYTLEKEISAASAASAASDRFGYNVKAEFLNSDGTIKRKGLEDALNKYNEDRLSNNLPELDIPPEKLIKLNTFYTFLKDYINFSSETGHPITGSGKIKKI